MIATIGELVESLVEVLNELDGETYAESSIKLSVDGRLKNIEKIKVDPVTGNVFIRSED
jgi:hypothetical protein